MMPNKILISFFMIFYTNLPNIVKKISAGGTALIFRVIGLYNLFQTIFTFLYSIFHANSSNIDLS